MKTRIAFIILVFAGFRAFGQVVPKTHGDSILLRAEALKQLYNAATEPDGTVNQVQFFATFPNSFADLCSLYGHAHDTAAILYYDARTHIFGLFSNLSQIDDSTYYRKFIALAVDAHWESGAANDLLDGLRPKILVDPVLATYILNSYPPEKIKNFWYFFFDGPRPMQQLPAELEKMKAIDRKMYRTIVKERNAVMKRNANRI